MKKAVTISLSLFFAFSVLAQDNLQDTTFSIKEVSVSAKTKQKIQTELKMAVSVDEFLASSQGISFIKRGAFAWEPLLNNLSSERSVITIDGMHIFGACTDKMDPVTSYLESNNLSSIEVNSGQSGNMHGSTIAGSINLKQKSSMFTEFPEWDGAYQTGFESTNKQFFHLGNLSYSSNKLTADGSISFRKAGNYQDGNNHIVDHSQYNKFNSSLGLSYRTSDLSSIRVETIFDKANDVGYPALPMDLWLSRAIITSASYKQLFNEKTLKVWDSKIYFNALEHYMDDTKRPENPVHMDMPGWSTTYGLVSKANFMKGKYQSEVQLNMYENISIAEMTMYPQDRSLKTMFAYSWPEVKTQYAGISVNNSWNISNAQRVDLGGSLALNHNNSKYVEFNRIFHPDASQSKSRILPALHANYTLEVDRFNFTLGAGYGERAPSVSEGYGYYIFNSFDRYDYIGNPDLKNESSYETNLSASFTTANTKIQFGANYFHIQDYIIGKILDLGSPMNYQSVGVKGYMSLPYANIYNLTLNVKHDPLEHLHLNGLLTYARAVDNQGGNLPFIRPLSYQLSANYMLGKFSILASFNGDFAQKNYSPEYGEDLTPRFNIWNMSADYRFQISNYQIALQAGVENLLNAYYSTYADWGNIPRAGRNIFTSVKFSF